MAEYIERKATVNLLQSLGSRDYRREKGTIQEAIKMVSSPEYTPAVEVQPVRHGRWENTFEDCDLCHRCSLCKQSALLNGNEDEVFSAYCPSCGAKMDEEVKEE